MMNYWLDLFKKKESVKPVQTTPIFQKRRWAFEVKKNNEIVVPLYFVTLLGHRFNGIKLNNIIPSGSFTLKYCDCVKENELQELFDWANLFHPFDNTLVQTNFTGNLTTYNGLGIVLEKWTFDKLAITDMNFGCLDYSNRDTYDLEITMSYAFLEYYWNKDW